MPACCPGTPGSTAMPGSRRMRRAYRRLPAIHQTSSPANGAIGTSPGDRGRGNFPTRATPSRKTGFCSGRTECSPLRASWGSKRWISTRRWSFSDDPHSDQVPTAYLLPNIFRIHGTDEFTLRKTGVYRTLLFEGKSTIMVRCRGGSGGEKVIAGLSERLPKIEFQKNEPHDCSGSFLASQVLVVKGFGKLTASPAIQNPKLTFGNCSEFLPLFSGLHGDWRVCGDRSGRVVLVRSVPEWP